MKFSWFEWLPFQPWRLVATVPAADEVPAVIPPKGIVLVGSIKYPKWLAFDCPCGEAHRILISLDKANNPHWRIAPAKKFTLLPSIDAWRGKKRCHFFIRDGKTQWAREIRQT
jgi:hypothetical protein